MRLSELWTVLVLLAVAGGVARAGDADPAPVSGRTPVLLLGASRSTFAVGDMKTADPKPFWSPRLGITYTAPRDAVTAFEFGLWADSRGGEWKESVIEKRAPSVVAQPERTQRLRLLYVSVPIMMRFTLPSRPLTPYVKGGLAPSALVSARQQTRETATGRIISGYHGVRNQMNVFHLDALAGIGVRTNVAQHALVLETLYMYGLTDVLKGKPFATRPNLKNRSVQFFLGIGLLRERAAE
jgi:hypothetical protein